MGTSFPLRSLQSDWRRLYLAALLEPDKNIACQKVSEAEAAILERVQVVSHTSGADDEKEALDDALYLLRAFRNAQSQPRRR
jgi:hypothetical protein